IFSRDWSSDVCSSDLFVFFITSGDSATLVLGMMSTGGTENPSTRIKLVWGMLIAGSAASLLLAGGVQAIQTATIVFALPFAIVKIGRASCRGRVSIEL